MSAAGAAALALALALGPPPASPLCLERPGVALEVDPDLAADAARIADASAAFVAAAVARLGAALPPSGGPLRVRAFASLERKALATGTMEAFSVAEDGMMAAFAVEPGVAAQDGRAEALAVLIRALGPPSSLALREGAARAFAGATAAEDARVAAAWIRAAGEATPLADLADDARFQRRSLLVQAPLAAVLVELLLERGGAEGFAAAWRGGVDAAALEPLYQAALDAVAAERADWMRDRRERRAASRALTGASGICFAQEGYRIVDGYASAMAKRSLARARALGASAASFTPFGYYRSTRDPEIRWPRRSGDRPGHETDEAVLAAAAHAKGLGMVTMLKPHLWGYGWCGDLRMESRAAWTSWFEGYGEFLVHHALLAEIGGFDWLSIGCELGGTTADHAAEWQALAARARRLFAGGITYAANWGTEMESLGFAGALDAVGVDCYYPLAEGDAPSDQELRAGAAAALARVAALELRHGRPVLLTEVGYPLRANAWREPHRQGGDGALTTADQARCLAAFAAAFREQPEPRVRGFYLWKWPTFDSFEEARRADYWPVSAPAQAALAGAFR